MIVIGLACVILPIMLFWIGYLRCFIPGRIVYAKVLRVTLKHTQDFRRTVTGRRVFWIRGENYVRVEYTDESGLRCLADSVLPDFTERIIQGDVVKVLLDRCGHTKMILLSGPLDEDITSVSN